MCFCKHTVCLPCCSRSPCLCVCVCVQTTEHALSALSKAGRGLQSAPLSVFEKLYAVLTRVFLRSRALGHRTVEVSSLDCASLLAKQLTPEQVSGPARVGKRVQPCLCKCVCKCVCCGAVHAVAHFAFVVRLRDCSMPLFLSLC